ncbi:hypothetical protein [Pseudonocardia sp. N23]|uniref:hypothetical protein n=1 Tax=Pseudonocardia sp. N23 TaxID=1987376 RepID=UPI0011459CE3|nr:hypothetical protein [Pseudonocardia sp. N23]
MTTLLVLVLVLAALSAAVTRYGADSRERTGRPAFERPPRRHTVTADVAALGSRLARATARPQRTADERALAQGVHSQYPRAKTSTV